MKDSATSSPSTQPNQLPPPAVLEAVRKQAQHGLSDLLRLMCDKLDAVLQDWARALPDAEQQPYMDTMVVMRRGRADVESQFSANLASAFMRLLQPRLVKGGAAAEVDYSSLSLVGTEDMDISVALDTVVARARLEHAGELGLLRRRYAHLLPKLDVSERTMPLDPGNIAHVFRDAIQGLDLGVTEKLLLLRLFQQAVLAELGGLLAAANQQFIDAGVLPDLKMAFAAGDPAKRTAAKPEARQEKSKSAADTEEIFSLLHGLLGQSQGRGLNLAPNGAATGGASGPGGAGGSGGMGGGSAGPTIPGAQYHAGHYVGGGGIGNLPAELIGGSVAAVPIAPLHIAPTAVVQAVATPELLSLLSHLQQQQPCAPLLQDASSPSVSEVREHIRDGLRSDEEKVEAVNQADEDVINLVSMLFDFILDDDDLPMAMKALIGRLQIPLLKVAILDKTFFNAESHPARRLLNALAKAGIGWNSHDPGGDVLYAKIEEVVFRILNEFIEDLGLFDELLEEFTVFHAQQLQREEAVDRRTQETEEGRARAELARAMVQQTLNRRLTGRQLPLVVVKLLQDAWRNVLYINCLKDGTDSESWKQAVKVVDATLWSVLPQAGQEWQQRLKDVAPKLVNSLKKGLAGVHYDPLATETLLRELAQVHFALLQGQATATVAVLEAKNAGPVARAQGQLDARQINEADVAGVDTVVMPQAEAIPAAYDELPGDNEHVLQVSRLNVGSWVEFTEAERQDRHKLVARIRSVDKLIFANRRGIKVSEMSGMKLALAMHAGRARIVQEGEFIDRALESVIGNLREMEQGQR